MKRILIIILFSIFFLPVVVISDINQNAKVSCQQLGVTLGTLNCQLFDSRIVYWPSYSSIAWEYNLLDLIKYDPGDSNTDFFKVQDNFMDNEP